MAHLLNRNQLKEVTTTTETAKLVSGLGIGIITMKYQMKTMTVLKETKKVTHP